MSDPIPPPKSAARTWLRVLAWIIPGVASPAILLFAISFTMYGSMNDEFILIGSLVLFATILIGCGFFNAILRPPDRAERQMSPAKSITLAIVIFILFQILLVPAIGYTVAGGCILVTTNM